MADKSGIEWTDATWNPTTGCDRVSPGCDHCYALTMAKRLKAMGSSAYQEDGDPRTSGPGFALQVHKDRLDQPLRWTKPRRIFVNSMSDLFHPRVPDEFIARVFAVMAGAPQHTFQVLTKRPKRMRALVGDAVEAFVGSPLISAAPDEETARALRAADWPLPNVWLGTSVEDQRRADDRIPALVGTAAAVRFLSMEPLLGPVRIQAHLLAPTFPGPHVGWVILGGESGPGARPMHPGWVRDLRDQAVAARVPFFFKQWGAWSPTRTVAGDLVVLDDLAANECVAAGSEPGTAQVFARVGKHTAGRVLDDRTWDDMPACAARGGA